MRGRTDPSTFHCTQCGECCRWPGNVILREQDIERLAAHLRLDLVVFIEQYTTLARNRRALSLAEDCDGACVFLVNNRCTVYPARPCQCRDFPFAWGNSMDCPAINEHTC
ncbi:MAG: YkgJ family cysteine cluster protein [Verrucomicrobia bacterium]|nr:YkgJ family cysteine cluster protein [Verrucomicrobiota bacterium]